MFGDGLGQPVAQTSIHQERAADYVQLKRAIALFFEIPGQ
jgi:hypothetical protein